MEAIILGEPYSVVQGGVTPIEIPAYEADEAIIQLADGYNPYIISSSTSGDSYWYRYSTGILRPATSSDKVIIGGTSFYSTESLRVVGGINISGLQIGSTVYISSILDEDNMASDSNTAVPTQQSVKAYVDSQIGGYLQSGDNISELVNDEGYISSESDPVFVASVAHNITATDYSHWTTAYGWGNHATVGYLTVETDPIFSAHVAYGISSTNISNWNTAYTNNHTHTNKTLLDSLISSGFGNQFLGNDGTYHTISNTVSGSDTYVQFNDGGVFGSDSNFNYIKSTGKLYVPDIELGNIIYVNGDPYITSNGTDLIFYDTTYGSTITLSTLAAGATNPWTIASGYINYGTGTDKVGINTVTTPNATLQVVGNITATDFNSNYVKYDSNGNLRLGNITTTISGTNSLYIGDMIYGEFNNYLLNIDADLTLSGKLNLNTGNIYVWGDGSEGNLVFKDENAASGAQITLNQLIDGTYNAAIVDFTDLTAVQGISSSLISQWNTAYSQRHTHIDGILDWSTNVYQPYAAQQAALVSFDTSSTNPVLTTRLNLNAGLYVTQLDVIGKLTVGGLIDPTGLQLTPVAANPGDANTIWSNSGDSNALYYGTTPVGGGSAPTDDILDWSTNKYTPYTTRQAFLSFDTDAVNYPNLTGAINLNGELRVYKLTSFNAGGILTQSSSATAIQANGIGTSNTATFASSNDNVTCLITQQNWSSSGTITNPVLYLQRNIAGTGNITGSILNIVDNPSTSGTTSYKLLSATIGLTERISFNPRVADGSSAVAYLLDTHNSLSTSGAKFLSIKNAGVETLYLGVGKSTGLGFYTGTTAPDETTRLNLNGILYSTGVNTTSSSSRPLTVFAYSDSYSSLISGTHRSLSITRAVAAQTGTISQNLISIDNLSSGTANTTGTLIAITDNPTSSGTTNYKLLSATIGSTERISLNPRVVSTGSAVAYMFDTHNTLSGGDRLLSIRNNGTEYAYVNVGGVHAPIFYGSSIQLSSTTNDDNAILFSDGTTTRFKFQPNATDGATTVAYFLDTKNVLSTGGAKIVSIKNQGTEKNYLDKDGAIWYAAATPTTADGLMWNDSTQKCFKVYEDGVAQYDTKVLFQQTADKTVGNTTTETSLIGTGIGTNTLPANFLVAGKTITIKISGYISGTNGDSGIVNIKLGSVTLVTSTGNMPATLTNTHFDGEFMFTCRTTGATGTVIGQGKTVITGGVGLSTTYTRALTMTTTATIDTTTSNSCDITYTWGTASTSNTITVTNLSIKVES